VINYILLMAMTWVVTRLYYTGKLEKILWSSDLIEAKCHKCSNDLYLTQENIRAVNYCNGCK
jgi:hypothetical protein